MNFWESDNPRRMHIDLETWCDVSLPDVGTSRYTNHVSFEVLMAAYAFGDEEPRVWLPAEGEPMPADFEDGILDNRILKTAWNDPFEKSALGNGLGLEIIEPAWFDTMVLALSCSLPGTLAVAGEAVGLPMEMQKHRRGKDLMRKFSIPRKPTKNDKRTRVLWHEDFEAWQEYIAYCKNDVISERAIFRRLWKHRPIAEEFELRLLDQKINSAGLPINLGMVNNAIKVYEDVLDRALKEMAALTSLPNPNSPKQLLPWLQERGYPFDDLKKGHVKTARRYVDDPPDHWGGNMRAMYCDDPVLSRVLDLRLQTSRTSIKKYYALERATDEDGMIRHVLQMNGAARTGRYAGRIYQPQNLPRPEKRFEAFQPALAKGIETLDADAIEMLHGDVFDVLASGLRPSAQAPEGYLFIDADLSAIENRVLGWIAGCDKILDVFRQKRDPYISFASYLYAQPYDELMHEYKVLKNSAKRTIGKPGTLGCGYQMGPGKVIENRSTGEIEGTGLLGYAWNMGVKSFTLADSEHSVKTFRETFKEVPDYWYAIERAAKNCLKTGRPVEFGVLRFEMDGPFLCMVLPSGRALRYLRPRIEPVKTPWGDMKMQITYEGMNDKKQWKRQHTTPGKLTENADQAISRDLLTHGMMLADKRGIDIRLHVHDQIVGLVREDEADEQLRVLIECMEEPPVWADGLPLGSEGFTTPVFMKD